MAILSSNQFDTYTSIGRRENLTDMIYNIAPTETPFISNIGKAKGTQTLFEWQTDTLAAARTNAQLEGDDYDSVGYNVVAAGVTAGLTATVRLTNSMQISAKTVIVTGTDEVVMKAGRKSEIGYMVARTGKELKRDIELDACSRNPQVSAGAEATARQSRGLEHWIQTNVSSGGSYSYTDATTVLTDGNQRNLTEALFKDAVQQTWTAGGDPEFALCGPVNKQNISSQFAGIATLYRDQKGVGPAQIIGAADIYVSDFGEMKIVPSRFSRDRTISILQRDMWAVAWLRPMAVTELAKTGDAEKRLLICEWTVQSKNEAASGKVADLNTSIL